MFVVTRQYSNETVNFALCLVWCGPGNAAQGHRGSSLPPAVELKEGLQWHLWFIPASPATFKRAVDDLIAVRCQHRTGTGASAPGNCALAHRGRLWASTWLLFLVKSEVFDQPAFRFVACTIVVELKYFLYHLADS